MRFILPLPPSINQTYGVNRNAEFPMYKRQKVKDWEEAAGWDILQQKDKSLSFPLTGTIAMGVVWYYKDDRDVDAGLKVLLDVFQKFNIYKNDRQVRRILGIDIFEDKANPRAEVFLEELDYEQYKKLY